MRAFLRALCVIAALLAATSLAVPSLPVAGELADHFPGIVVKKGATQRSGYAQKTAQKEQKQRPVMSSSYAASQANAAYAAGAIVVRHKGLAAGDGDDLDDYDTAPAQSIADPLEPWNRFWFRFNDIFYTNIARPVYRGWEAVTHEDIRSGLKNFFHNLMFPMRFVNNILQFRFLEAGVEFGRFIINTTTSAGFANVAKDKKTIVPVDPSGEDFGQTLGYWGVGHGIYIVWPFLGPSSLRETVGFAGDIFTDPLFYLSPWPVYYETTLPDELGLAIKSGLYFNALDGKLDTYEAMKGAAVDPYIATREAWVKYRAVQVAR